LRITVNIPDWLENYLSDKKRYIEDIDKMSVAIDIAKMNIERGGGPFGAVIFDIKTGKIASCGANLVLQNNISILHAEIVALMIAQNRFNSYSLSKVGDFELFSSSEPCTMCLGAILWSGVKRVVYGAPSIAARKIGFDEGPVFDSSWEYLKNKGIRVKGGLSKEKVEEVLNEYSIKNGIIYNP